MNFPDGVYFCMPEEVYHRIHRFSSSGVKKMIVSNTDFWTDSWLNPENAGVEVDGEDDATDSLFKMKGRAYHCRLLEGTAAFDSRYGFKITEADIEPNADPNFPPVFRTSDEIKDALQFIGVPGLSKMKKDALVDTLLFHRPEAKIWDYEVRRHAELNGDKTLIPRAWKKDIEVSAAMIERNPHLCNAFKCGFAEVTVLWTKTAEEYDESTGEVRTFKVPCKARMDYRKPKLIVDYKTFGNNRGRAIKSAVIAAMAERKNHIQVAIYYEADDALVIAIKEGRTWTWGGDSPMPWPVAAGASAVERVNALASPALFSFVFQQTGRAPVAVGRTMPRSMNHVDFGKQAFNRSCVDFAKSLALYGTDIWVHVEPVSEFDDLDFPIYAAEL